MSYKNIYKDSEIHQKVLVETLKRYKARPLSRLILFRDVYQTFRKDAIRDRDSRWKIPQDEGKLCIKEHLKLIQQAIDSKQPIIIKCKSGSLGATKA